MMVHHILRALVVLASLLSVTHGAGMFTMGYYAYYERNGVPPTAVDYSKLTHIALGAVYCTPTGEVIPANWVDNEAAWENFVNSVTALAHNVNTKTVLMFGGASISTADIRSATSPGNYVNFATNLVNHAQSLSFDGIDLDWESDIDWPSMTRLASKIRELWPECFLTMPVNIGMIKYNGTEYDPAHYVGVVPYLDAVNMMSYSPTDNSEGWDGPWHVSPLTGDASGHPYSIKQAVDIMGDRGIQRSKIGIGMAFFGSCWGAPITQPVQPQGNNRLLASDNDMSYRNIAASYRPQMTYNYDVTAQVPYLNHASGVGPKGCTYISFDDDTSIAAKADYSLTNGLAGIIIWTVAEGVLADGTNPALTSVYNHFGRTYTPPTTTVTTTTTTTAAITTASTATTGSSSTYTTSHIPPLSTSSVGHTTLVFTIGRTSSTTAASTIIHPTLGVPTTTTGGLRYFIIYSDSLATGLTDGSNGASLTNTKPVHSGTRSIVWVPTRDTGVFFYSKNRGVFDLSQMTSIEFFINGGVTGGQKVTFDMIVFDKLGAPTKVSTNPSITMQVPANTWTRVQIPFSRFKQQKYEGIMWHDGTSSSYQPVYIDDIIIFG
eukprot:Phypoly_transcript_04926.p1 GENE.Phypoly_transcript_04926~~Phypoly_transcript_04926.p1  ORF type:complete len:604 (+),score=66.72 Phypoly_transcript_04926:222-2033(+)